MYAVYSQEWLHRTDGISKYHVPKWTQEMFTVMGKLIEIINGKIGRINYFLSFMIVVVGLWYVDTFYLSDQCLVCNPIMAFPWMDLLEFVLATAVGGGYLCLLFCKDGIEHGFSIWHVILPIAITLFYFVQTIKRCHDLGVSGWRSLIPVYSPLFLLFLPRKNEYLQEPVKSSLLKTLWNSKLLILILLFLCWFAYHTNARYINMHKKLYKGNTSLPTHFDRLGGYAEKTERLKLSSNIRE